MIAIFTRWVAFIILLTLALPACAPLNPPVLLPPETADVTPTMDPQPVPANTSLPDPNGTPTGARYLALGDSYTIGESVSPAERWPIQLADRLRQQGLPVQDPLVIARTGWTTGELAAALDSAAPEGPFDLVTLLIGVNDQYRGRPVDGYRPEFRALLARAIELSGGRPERVIVLSIPDWGVTPFSLGRDQDRIRAEIDVYNQANRAETLRAGAGYIDVTGISRQASQDADLIAGDGLHPSGKMYAAWVDAVLPAALEALACQPDSD